MPPTPNPQPLTPSVLIIGVGSPFGDDAAGLEVARRLESRVLPARTRVVAADRPGVDLIEIIDGADAVILIDAVRSGGCPGEIHDLDLAEILALAPHLVSSHGLGLDTAIELARRLGGLPPCGRLLGIEISERVKAVEPALSKPVSAAVEDVVRRAATWAALFATEIARGIGAPR